MSVYEYIGNLHVHTVYSDGKALHADVARAAGKAGLHFVVCTDHNVWVDGVEGYYENTLLLVGEEIHDVRLQPQSNHLLVYNTQTELSPKASAPQALIDEVNRRGGVAYIAHPFEYSSPVQPGLDAIPWTDWDVTGYAGLEIWNTMSEFKALMRNKLAALIYTTFPAWGITGPFQATLRLWDDLLAQGKRVAAIGNADAHGNEYSVGKSKRTLLPYDYLFRCVNTHILTERPFNGILEHDRALVYSALRAGRTFVGYDLPAPTAGFRFTARSGSNVALMGDEIVRTGATIFEIQAPDTAHIRLVCNGKTVVTEHGTALKHTTAEPGVYRVEVYRTYQLSRRGWIFSSPIAVV
ncbi:MAG: CehA/McbA family metallohydrolase [Chloroflexi bacterium]|nr:CehA/McbA family metallohydrolase [Chloroflexota bacterium]